MMPQLRRAVLIGLAFGAGAVHLAVVGVLLMLHQRWIVIDTLSLGQAVLLVIAGGAGAMAGHAPLPGAAVPVPQRACRSRRWRCSMAIVPLQSIFIALSPDLLDMLTLELGPGRRRRLLIGGGAVAGLLGAASAHQPRRGAPRDLSRRDRACWSPACSRN